MSRNDKLPKIEQEIETISHKIKPFEVMILYDRQSNHFDYTYLAEFPSAQLKENIASNNIFPRVQSKVFVVTKQAYEENKALFHQIRLRARKEVIIRLTEYMVAKFFTSYEHYLAPLLTNNPTLKWEILTKLYYRYEQLLGEDTLLNEEIAWEKFIHWYQTYLTNNVLDVLIDKYGLQYIEQLSLEDLNDLFFKKLNEQLFQDNRFMNQFTQMVNLYIDKWITDIGLIKIVEDKTIEDMIELFGMQAHKNQAPSFESIVKDNYYIVFSNMIYQSILKALSNNEFVKDEDGYSAVITANRMKGKIILKIDEQEQDEVLAILDKQAELIVDILDMLSHMYVNDAVTNRDLIEVELNQLLEMRGIQAKLAGNGRRGGFEKEQREQVWNALLVLQRLYVDIEEIIVYENNKRVQKAIKGKALHFYQEDKQDIAHIKDEAVSFFYLQLGKVFIDYLSGSGRQVKLLPKKVLTYHPYQKTIEKKLMRYFSWRFRTQARRGAYLQPLKIKTLLKQIHYERKSTSPARYRDRFEKALDELIEDRLIASWQYEDWDENIVQRRRWIDEWLETSIIIMPPQSIITYYQPLEKKQDKKSKPKNEVLAALEVVPHDIGSKIKQKRIDKQLTLAQVAKEIGISVSYLSHIERGVKKPSYQLYDKIKSWL